MQLKLRLSTFVVKVVLVAEQSHGVSLEQAHASAFVLAVAHPIHILLSLMAHRRLSTSLLKLLFLLLFAEQPFAMQMVTLTLPSLPLPLLRMNAFVGITTPQLFLVATVPPRARQILAVHIYGLSL